MGETCVAVTLLVRKKYFVITKLCSIVLNCIISKVKVKALIVNPTNPLDAVRLSSIALNTKPHFRPSAVRIELHQTH